MRNVNKKLHGSNPVEKHFNVIEHESLELQYKCYLITYAVLLKSFWILENPDLKPMERLQRLSYHRFHIEKKVIIHKRVALYSYDFIWISFFSGL